MSRILEKLDRQYVQHLTAALHQATLEARGQLASNPSMDAIRAERAVHRALKHYATVADTLEDSGADDLLKKRDSQLTSIASRDNTPARDLKDLGLLPEVAMKGIPPVAARRANCRSARRWSPTYSGVCQPGGRRSQPEGPSHRHYSPVRAYDMRLHRSQTQCTVQLGGPS
jgi:hypothetical protein